MRQTVVVVGAGMGGLAASIRLARRGFQVRVVEARADAGGLASGFKREGLPFDAGPYILLDRPGLQWAFHALGLALEEHVALRRIEDVYAVFSRGEAVHVSASLEETAAGFDRRWPGSGARYTRFVQSAGRIYRRLRPMQHVPRPRFAALLRGPAWQHAPFLLSSLGSVLARTGLPPPIVNAIAIWTHVAGQTMEEAPSPMAFVPALIHGVGSYYPDGGIGAIPRALAAAAAAAGVEFQYGTKVRAICSEGHRVRAVETDRGERVAADAVVSNASGVATYLELVKGIPHRARDWLQKLPLQSPGVCAYLAVKGKVRPPYLRFSLPGGGELCRLLVLPGALDPEHADAGWQPARLIAPMRQDAAERAGPDGQREYLERILAESWWREYVGESRVLATRVPADWGAEFHLYRDSMNPVMTAHFMRAGRLAHRSPFVRGLYLAGSSTHPGQWVSFCAISGILAADQVSEDLA